MIDKAIILAAGMGKRLGGAIPKPLLPLDEAGTTFLDWHLRALAMHGCRDVTIVGSPVTVAAKTVLPARWILNDFPGELSGSGHSAHLAFPHVLDGRSRVVLMDADVVYDPLLFGELARAPSTRSKTLVCGAYRDTAEEVMVFADERGVPRLHGKGLLGTPLVSGLRPLGEATGILMLEPDDHEAWLAASSWCMQYATARTRSEHEDITQRLFTAGLLRSVVFSDGRRFMECDTPEEYAVVRNQMAPRWSRALAVKQIEATL